MSVGRLEEKLFLKLLLSVQAIELRSALQAHRPAADVEAELALPDAAE